MTTTMSPPVADALTLWSSRDANLRQALLQCGLFKLDRSGRRLIARTIETDSYGSSGMNAAERFALFCQSDEFNQFPSDRSYAQQLHSDALHMRSQHDADGQYTQATWENAVLCSRFAACYGDAHTECPMVGSHVDNDMEHNWPAWRSKYVQARRVYGAESPVLYTTRIPPSAQVVIPRSIKPDNLVQALVMHDDGIKALTGSVTAKASNDMVIRVRRNAAQYDVRVQKQGLAYTATWTEGDGAEHSGRLLCVRQPYMMTPSVGITGGAAAASANFASSSSGGTS